MSDLNTNSGKDLSLEGVTLTYTSYERSQKAKNQTRDRFGRWISAGANVRWKQDGREWSGTVKRIEDGMAVVSVTRGDGTKTEAHLKPASLRVLASKATLPTNDNRFYDKDNNFANKLKAKEVQDKFDATGHIAIEREDGYMLDKFEKRPKDETNPLMYQLFGPGGVSLGKYGAEAEGTFDDMVSDHQNSNPPAGEAPAGGVVASGEEKPFRVPDGVKSEIAAALADASSSLSAEDIVVATRLANDSTVSLSDVNWVHAFFAATELEERVRGGFKGKKWATKIITPSEEYDDEDVPVDNRYDFDDDTFDYFAVYHNEDSESATGLLAVDYESGAVYEWITDAGFSLIPGLNLEDVDHPSIVPLDELSVEKAAKILDSGEASFDPSDLVPEERNLFSLAEPEIDWEEIDRTVSIIAAASDGEYTPFERSANAKAQKRGAGGKFGEQADEPVPTGSEVPKVVKATLPVELPLVEDVAARINDWIASEATEAPVMAAGTPEEAPESYPAEEQAIEDGPTGPQGEAVYFAIVDDVNKQAVMDAIAIVKQGGQPQAYIRQAGAWVASPDTLTLLMGSTPPPVVELADPNLVKETLAQIDGYDKEQGTEPPAAATGSEPAPVAASAGYYAMPDGSLPIFDAADLSQAVTASLESADTFVKAHIRTRGRALNRMDLVPEAWRSPSLAEIGEIEASVSVYGEYGEVITAAGIRGKGGNAETLKNYWTRGKGALKIRWGTPGDLTRAHRHLAKYVGLDRAWGLAQRYHQSIFGVSNTTHDRATGQYRGR